jgi:hypothetical protein
MARRFIAGENPMNHCRKKRAELLCVLAPAIAGLLIAACCSEVRGADQRELGNERILAEADTVFPVAENLVLRGYSNRKQIARPATVAHAVVMIHGILRNPDNYYLPAREVLIHKSIFAQVALIAVGFDDRKSAPREMPRLALFNSDWKHGGFGGLNPDAPDNTLNSFTALDRILVDLKKTCPQLKQITIIGHSAGAQFVDRYSLLGTTAADLQNMHLRFVAIAPSSVLYPGELRPKVDKKGKLNFSAPSADRRDEFNQYPYGLGSSPLFARIVHDPVAERKQWIRNLHDRDMIYAVGVKDTTARYLDKSAPANAQGPNRYDRLKYYDEFLKSQYHSTNHRLIVIAGAGHYSQRLIKSPEMGEFFSDR